MNTEEITVKLGVDTKGVGVALRGLSRQFQSMASTIKPMFENLWKNFSGLASIAGITAAAQSIKSYATQVEDLAETTNSTTDFVQGFTYAVSQNAGTSEAAGKAMDKLNVAIGEALKGGKSVEFFDKLGIALRKQNGEARSTGDVMLDIADRTQKLGNAAERTAMLAEVFGKKLAGQLTPALSMGGNELERFIDKADKMSAEDIKAIDDFSDAIDSTVRDLKIQGGTIAAFWGRIGARIKESTGFGIEHLSMFHRMVKMAKDAGTLAGGGPVAPISTRDGAKAQKATTPAEDPEKAQKAMTSYIEEYRRYVMSKMNDEQKAALMNREALQIQEKQLGFRRDSAEFLKLESQLLAKLRELNETNKKIETDKIAQQKEQLRLTERRRDAVAQINAAAERKDKAVDDLGKARSERSKFTLQELSEINLGYNMTPQMAQQVMGARQVRMIEERARQMASLGYDGQSQLLFNRAEQMRGGLTALTESDRFPLKSMQDSIQEQTKGIAELVRKASEEGLIMIPKNGK